MVFTKSYKITAKIELLGNGRLLDIFLKVQLSVLTKLSVR